MVIDDDPDMLTLMDSLLGQAGHQVESCLAGSYGLPTIASWRPDVVLTDLVMAEVDGLEVCSEIKGRDDLKAIKVIVVSGKDHDHWKQEAAKRGASGYIVKPIDPETFANTVVTLAG